MPYRPASSTADWLVFGAPELRERVLCGIAGSGALVLGVATSHGLAFAGVARPTRAWRGLALLCDEGPPPFPMPRVWASLGPIAWARPDVWVAVAADERPSAGRGGPRWRFVRWQQDLLVAERSPERVATALSLMPEASAGERA